MNHLTAFALGALVSFGTVTVPITALKQSGASSNQTISWNGTHWVAVTSAVRCAGTYSHTDLGTPYVDIPVPSQCNAPSNLVLVTVSDPNNPTGFSFGAWGVASVGASNVRVGFASTPGDERVFAINWAIVSPQ